MKKYSPEAARYAAYSLSDAAYAFISPAGPGSLSVALRPKAGVPLSGLAARFRAALKDEAVREALFEENKGLREFMILKALSDPEPAPAPAPAAGLTPEQEKELDALIAQVEQEIKSESAPGKDPLGITRRWEDKHGVKNRSKKK
ncbi:MAG: hypothetical protein RQ748_04515 [Elusimicrobiales bacterium]|nr:hypothetical protein [Elusimicrobiales bacterium]